MEIILWANFIGRRSQGWRQLSQSQALGSGETWVISVKEAPCPAVASFSPRDSGSGRVLVLSFKSLDLICRGIFDLF